MGGQKLLLYVPDLLVKVTELTADELATQRRNRCLLFLHDFFPVPCSSCPSVPDATSHLCADRFSRS